MSDEQRRQPIDPAGFFRNGTLEQQIGCVRELMTQDVAMTQLLMPYYKRLLQIGSKSALEPYKVPFIEDLAKGY